MQFISTPLQLTQRGNTLSIERQIGDRVRMLDNLIELIVFTPRGSFAADPDFGFEYWNHEYSNVQYRAFNNDQTGMTTKNVVNEITREECHESIRRSLATYAPQLKNVVVEKRRSEKLHDWVVDKIKSTYVRIGDEYKDCQFEYEGWIR